MANNTGSIGDAHVRQFTPVTHIQACVHDSAPISRPILIKFGMQIQFTKVRYLIKNSVLMRQCKGRAYKTAEIILLSPGDIPFLY